MSASGDYDVSIVESFAPPAKWVPGQAVNKDVYAVNTGNVEAYVKETVTSVMTIVTEEAYDGTANKPDADSIELSAGERYVVEAGAYLAYAPLASEYTYDTGTDAGKVKSGLKVIAMNPDFKDDNGYTSADPVTDFKPDAEGLYVFRRTIGVDPETQLENYTYDAYYYVPGTGDTTKEVQKKNEAGLLAWSNDGGTTVTYAAVAPDAGYEAVMEDVKVDGVGAKFYKVSNLAVTPEKATFAGDEDQRDGMVSATTAPTYGFYKDVTKTVVPKLTYDKANNRLVASYDTGMAIDQTKLTNLAKAYEDAAIAYEDALEEYAAAVADQQTGRGGNTATDAALKTASDNLLTELANLLAAQRAEQTAKDNYDKAYAEMLALEAAKDAALTEKNNAASDLGESNDPTTANTLWGRYNKAAADLGTEGDLAPTQDTAWGRENKASNDLGKSTDLAPTQDTAWGRYNKAHGDLTGAEPDAREAFLDIVVEKESTVSDETEAEAFLNNLTYDEIVAKGYVNETDAEYDYYRMFIADKYAKEELDDAQSAYDTAVEERIASQDALAKALATRQEAEAALGDETDTTTMYDPATGANNTAVGRYNYAKKQYEDKMKELYGHAEGGTSEETTAVDGEAGKYTDGSLYDLWQDAIDATATAQSDADAAQDAYNTALAASNVATANVTAAANHLAETRQAKENAWATYDAAQKADNGELKININLADVVTEGGVADKWQLLPESLEDVYTNTLNTTTNVNTITEAADGEKDTASFYYTSILGGGETTSKLIDSVELDSSVTKEMFKYFDFDLNVTLNSAQVNIDSDGNYTAETAQTELGKYAILSDNTSADTAITWSNTAAAASKKYKSDVHTAADGSTFATAVEGVTIDKLDEPANIGGTYYIYKATASGVDYYGNSLSKDAVYVNATESGDTYTVDNNKKLKLDDDATVDNT